MWFDSQQPFGEERCVTKLKRLCGKLIIFATLLNVSLLILIERPKAYRFRVFLSVSNFFAFF